MLAERFRRFDADGNGSFTVAELGRVMHQQAAERCRAVFARLDLDGDGALTAVDRESARPTRVSKRDVPKPRDERRVAR
jgi:Ca2+-binding EF-hand superfamily protein